MLVGHNPGIERLAIALSLSASGPAERSRAEKLAEKFPTAALAVLEADGSDWSAFKPGSARLVEFIRPKDLERDKDEP
jgi:phosphohistidine phosphatase